MARQPAIASSLDSALEDEWRRWANLGLSRTLRGVWGRSGAEVTTPDGPAIDFSSNDSLGLASDRRIAAAGAAMLAREGTGATASRLIAGNHPEHEQLEHDVADFFDAPAAITFATGYAANTGVIPCLAERGDVVFSDALNHASLIDGCRMARASVHVFPHADIGALRALLESHRAAHRRALIVTDGLFSMDGDRAHLPEIVSLASEFDAWTYVDDAHAAGVLGANARGTAEETGCSGAIDVTIGTFGKAFGVAGAFVYGSDVLCRHVLNRARTFVFSTAVLPAQAAAAREALRIVAAEPERRARLRDNTARVRASLAAQGIAAGGNNQSHIVPVVVGAAGETMRIAAALRAQGLLVGAVRPPTVPDGSSRLRISVSAAHTDRHIGLLVSALGALVGTG